METTPSLRPMSVGDLLDAAFRLYRKHFVTFVGIVALVLVPVAIIQAILQYTVVGRLMTEISAISTRPPLRPGQNPFDVFPIAELVGFYLVLFGVTMIQSLLVGTLINGALTNVVQQSYQQREVTLLGAYRFGVGRFFSLLGTLILIGLLTTVLTLVSFACPFGVLFSQLGQNGNSRESSALIGIFVLLILAGMAVFLVLILLFTVRLVFATQAVILEDKGPMSALRRSWELVRGSFWRVLGVTLLMGLLAYLVTGLPAAVLSFALGLVSGNELSDVGRNQAIVSLVSQLGLIIALPLQLIVLTLQYYDLRVRREGYDLELRAQQAAAL